MNRASHPLLVDDAGHVECLLGNEAIVRGAIEAGVAFACGYPGTPSSEVTDTFARLAPDLGIPFEYSINEKVSLEMAYAASLAGARSICAMKHLGLMVAGDPLSTIPYVGTVGGMVIVSAGDPSCRTSPNEQDQRWLGQMLHLPTLDPSTAQEACDLTREAFELSERCRLPVLMRITARVCHTRAPVRFSPISAATVGGFIRDPERFLPTPPNARRLRREIPDRLATARAWMVETGVFQRRGGGRRAILATGSPAATCADLLDESGTDVLFATLSGVHPLPETPLVEFLSEVDEVLVVEELSPFLEDALRVLCAQHGLTPRILGKRSGHLPEEYEYDPPVIQRGIAAAFGLLETPAASIEAPDVPTRAPTLCAACPHRSAYFAAKTVFGDDTLYFNDIGCYTLGASPPLSAGDALLCMGAGFTLAAGVSRVTGKRTIGFVGDSTFFHAGMPALLNAIKEEVNMVAVILDNQVTAMTGFQESPGVEVEASTLQRSVSIAGVARSLGARHVETIDPQVLPAAIQAFERARDHEGVSVIIAEHPCPVALEREVGPPRHDAAAYEIDHARCQTCGLSGCGLQCSQPVIRDFERQLSQSRALEEAHGACHSEAVAAPCSTRCPLGLCIQGYANHIAAGQYEEALELIMARNPLPDSVCRVCHRPCESVCVRRELEGPIAVNDLKRFVVEWAAAEGVEYAPEMEPEHGRRAAVIGAGPAGLAAAHDLRVRGYGVTVFDAADAPGGLLRSGIPAFRLPAEAVGRDVDRILGIGVEFVGGTVIGRDRTVSGLLGEGFDAVFVAVGASRPIVLDWVEDVAGGPTVVDANDYLARARGAAGHVETGRRVAVVGGGNAAMDAARTAVRNGAESVTVLYRRSRSAMPALVDEVEAAEHEGVTLRTWIEPAGFGPSGALACVRTEPGDVDASGRAWPVPVPGSEEEIDVDFVVVAAGQFADPAVLGEDLELERTERGALRVDPKTGGTSHPQVFAGGDFVPGPRMVTEAMAWGLRAAYGIDARLRGDEIAGQRAAPPLPEAWRPFATYEQQRPSRADHVERARPKEMPFEEGAGFDEIVGVLPEADARREAARCMVCGTCSNCRACLDLFGCPAFFVADDRIHIDTQICTGCGVCAEFCPNRAIVPAGEVSQ